jgi:hypothetical protein
VWETRDAVRRWVAPANYLDWRRMSTSFEGLAAFNTRGASLTVDGIATRERIAEVSGNFFEVLGLDPVAGRTFDPALSTGFAEAGLFGWSRSPAEAPEIRGFEGDLGELRDAWYFQVVGRLADEVSIEAARDDMAAIAQRLEALYPNSNRGAGTSVTPLLDETFADFRSTLVALSIAVTILLLASGINVTHLALGRGAARQADTAVRIALGAGRAALTRQIMVEGWLLGLGGAAVGLALARVGLRAGVTVLGDTLLRPASVAAVVVLGALIGTGIAAMAFARTKPWRPSESIRGRGWTASLGANGLVAARRDRSVGGAGQPTLRREPARPRHLRFGHGDPVGRRTHRQLRTGLESHESQSGDRDAGGVGGARRCRLARARDLPESQPLNAARLEREAEDETALVPIEDQFPPAPAEPIIRVGSECSPISAELELKATASDIERVRDVELLAVEVTDKRFELGHRQGDGFRGHGSGSGLPAGCHGLCEQIGEV